MANKIQFRRDTAANWTDANPLLSQGELGFETDTTKFKLGDGVTYWVDLAYAYMPAGPQDRITTGSVALVVNADGSLTFPDTTIQTTAFTGTGDISFQGTWIRNKDTGDLYISPQDGTTGLYFPSDTYSGSNAVQLFNSNAGTIQINSNGQTWTFNAEGGITFPDSTTQTTAYTGSAGFGSTSTLNNGSAVATLNSDGTLQANVFLAAESEGTSGGGFSFQGDGGYDTGMFSSGDGYLQFFNNSQQTMQVTTNGWNLSPNKILFFDKTSYGEGDGIQIGNVAEYFSDNQLAFIVVENDPLLINGNGIQLFDNNGGSAIIVGNTTAAGSIYGVTDTTSTVGQVRVITQEQGTAITRTWEFGENGDFKDYTGIIQNSTATNTIVGTTPVLIASYDTTKYDSSEHAIKIRDGAFIYSTKLDVITDGTDSWKNEYSVVANTSTLGSFAATIDGTQLNLTFIPTAATSLSLVGKNTMFPLQTPLAPPGPTTPPVTGYVGWYDASSFTGSTWDDMSGNNNHVTSISGSPSLTSVSGNGASLLGSAIVGGTGDSMTWPMNMPTDYTLFAVSRYNGSNKQRIYQLYRPGDWGWLFGHHDHKSGVAYHAGAITDWTDHFGDNWLITSDQPTPGNGLYHGNGVNYSLSGSIGLSYNSPLNINSKGDETSDWATAEVIIYDRQLNSGEIASIEAYIAAKYGISI